MDKKKELALEAEYYRKLRLLDEAEETLADYRKQMQQKTDALAEYIYNSYKDIEPNDSYQYIRQLEESAAAFNRNLKQKQQELEETRENERREFNRKTKT